MLKPFLGVRGGAINILTGRQFFNTASLSANPGEGSILRNRGKESLLRERIQKEGGITPPFFIVPMWRRYN
jgi:hypothetical protein